MPATWTTTNGTASEGVADAPRGVSAFFSLGQLSRFGTLYLLGEQDRIVGISGYVVRPPQARREKPRVSVHLGQYRQDPRAEA